MKTCENCHQQFSCEAATQKPCWCLNLTPAANIPARFKDCLCPKCIQPYLLREGEDFYYNQQGLIVFTSQYHLKRGHCCRSGCLHCPY